MGETQRFFDLIFYNNKYLNSISVPQFNFILSDCSISVLNRIKNTIVKREQQKRNNSSCVYTSKTNKQKGSSLVFCLDKIAGWHHSFTFEFHTSLSHNGCTLFFHLQAIPWSRKTRCSLKIRNKYMHCSCWT